MVRTKGKNDEDGGEILYSSKKRSQKVPFDKAVVYIQKLFSHTMLLQTQCEELQIHLYLSTSYSADDEDVYSDISTDSKDGVVDKMDSVIERTCTGNIRNVLVLIVTDSIMIILLQRKDQPYHFSPASRWLVGT